MALALALEEARVQVERDPRFALVALALGGLGLSLLAFGTQPASLGLSLDHLLPRVVGGLGLAIVLLLPAAMRWGEGDQLGLPWAVAAVAVSVGEEIAFRGALFAALEEVLGGLGAVLGTTIAWTAMHVFSQPIAFLPAVAAAGLLLGIWRWRFRDLVAPIIAHVIADLAL